MAEDEVRGDRRVRRRRVHRSAGRTGRPRRPPRRPATKRGTSSSPGRSAPASIRSCCSACAPGWTRSRSRSRRSPSRSGCRACARTGCGRRSPCGSPSSNGPATASCVIPGSWRSPRDHASGKGAVPRRWHHERGVGRVLRGRRGDDVPYIRARPITMDRFPAGIDKKGFIQKDVSKGFPAWLERVEVPKKDGDGPLPDRHGHAVAVVDRQPEHDHAARLDLARAEAGSPRHLRLRSRSDGGRKARRSPRRGARAPRSARRARAAELDQDVRIERLPHRRAARRQGRHGHGRRIHPRGRHAARQPRSEAPDAGVSQEGSRRAHPRRYRAQRLQRHARGGLCRPAQTRRAGLRAVHLGRGRGGRPSNRSRSRCGRWRRAWRRWAICGATCASADDRSRARSPN